MKSKLPIIIVGALIILLLIFVVAASVQNLQDQDQDLQKQSFNYKEKKPGGCYVLFKALPELYSTEIKPKVVTKPFADTYKKDKELANGYNLYVLVSDKLYATAQDVKDMLTYAELGNQLFLAVNMPDSVLLERLGLTIAMDTSHVYYRDSEQHYVNPALAPDTAFSCKGIFGGDYFTSMDTSITTILGTDEQHRPNFIRVTRGSGSILISLNPSAVTNYFLMHENNIASMGKEFSYTNNYQDNIYWDEYYKYQDYKRSEGDFSEWQVLMRYPAMRWALWLAILLLIIYIVFEGKRRQRIIPDKPVITNNSLEFVNALGQLYYQQHDNANLGQKIIQQWLEFIRTRFYMNTSYLNDTFIATLSHKSGIPVDRVREIIDSIHHIRLADQVSDDFLNTFYKNIQAFYLNTK
ncbi:hypothetical protein GO495_08775 [Chitinophaga oryziterrae]|uniref:DUF4350 domain-containing protein n=1 Tax=Chitinophaga oryziterrae TaxID=1031224 RepID=A0A6N8J5Y0_9BACT|nr:DUF4350 domain-containing protein [Chitinophaga oryziterrae]MVT40675.1 hypothetical protein [Chitinophaga oryziterrae]